MDRINYFAEFLWNNANFNKAQPVATATNPNGTTYTFEGLTPGYYLIKDQEGTLTDGMNDFYTSFIITLTSSTNVEVKGSVPTVTKQVSDELDGQYSAQISNQLNQLHYYEWVGTIPSEIEDYDFYHYEFQDTLSTGLTFNRIEEIYIKTSNGKDILYQDNASGTSVAGKPPIWYVPDSGTVGGQIRIGWENLKASYPNLLKSDTVHVRYSAKLNENAISVQSGNPNTVELIYSNNPYDSGDYGKTPPSTARVYTFDLEVHKVSDTGTNLQGAEFVLFHNHTETGNVVPVYAVVTNGAITSWTHEFEDATKLVSGQDGKITVTGLKKDVDYYLTETKAPDGFNTLYGNTEIEITDYAINDANEITRIDYEINNSDKTAEGKTAKVTLDVVNKGGTELPSTGGTGTTVMYIVGGILVLAAVVLLITKKRMSNAE